MPRLVLRRGYADSQSPDYLYHRRHGLSMKPRRAAPHKSRAGRRQGKDNQAGRRLKSKSMHWRGSSCAAVASVAEAGQRADNLVVLIDGTRRAGATTLQSIADVLNARGIPTTRGGQ